MKISIEGNNTRNMPEEINKQKTAVKRELMKREAFDLLSRNVGDASVHAGRRSPSLWERVAHPRLILMILHTDILTFPRLTN